MMHGYWGPMSGWGWLIMAVSMLAFWGVVVAVIVMLARGFGARRPLPPGSGRSTPEEILAERYARGEIDETEWRHRLDLIRDRLKS